MLSRWRFKDSSRLITAKVWILRLLLLPFSSINSVQLTSSETIYRYDNEICGPKENLNYNFHHGITNTEKIQFDNLLCRNKDSKLFDALKCAINFYRSVKMENIFIKNTAEDYFKYVATKRKKVSSKKFWFIYNLHSLISNLHFYKFCRKF